MATSKKADQAAPLPVRLRYDGPTDTLTITQDGVTIGRGQSGLVSVGTAVDLLGCDYADVTVLSGDVPAAWPVSHRKLDGIADRLGVTWPQPTNGQQPLTVADKAALLDAATDAAANNTKTKE